MIPKKIERNVSDGSVGSSVLGVVYNDKGKGKGSYPSAY